jgi:hypothetical protein
VRTRRALITLLGGAAVAWPLAAWAQQPEKMLRVGALSVQPRTAPIWLAFERRMAELGYKLGPMTLAPALAGGRLLGDLHHSTAIDSSFGS